MYAWLRETTVKCVLLLNKIRTRSLQPSQSRFIFLLSTLLPHAVRWIRSTSCSRMQHEKIQVKFLCFQLKCKADTPHWDQFKMPVSLLARPYCVKDRQGKTQGMCCFSPRCNSLFVVALSCSASGVFFLFLAAAVRWEDSAGRVLEGMKRFHTSCHSKKRKEDETCYYQDEVLTLFVCHHSLPHSTKF